MRPDCFKINGIEVGFADHPTTGTHYLPGALSTEVVVRRGRLRINVLTPSLELTQDLHGGTLDDEVIDSLKVDWLRLVTYHDLTVPEGRYNKQIQCPYGATNVGFEVYGWPVKVVLYGTIDVQEGAVHIQGVLRKVGAEGDQMDVPIEVVRSFEPKPLKPHRKPYQLQEALDKDPLLIYDLSIQEGIFDSFPEEVPAMKNLERLVIGNWARIQIDRLPEGLFELTALHTLSIQGVDLKALSPSIRELRALEELSITEGALADLPDEIGELPLLDTLKLSYNQLRTVPASILNLPRLTHLSLTSNPLSSLPDGIEDIPHLGVDRRHRRLYMDTSYKSNNSHPIDESLYGLARYPELRATLVTQIEEVPDLKQFQDFILDYSTVGTYLVYEDVEGEIPLGKTKVGGAPDLPRGVAHPTDDKGHLYLFHAQINCVDAASYQDYLPRAGMLYFFINDEEYAQRPVVLYHPDVDDLVRYVYPSDATWIDLDVSIHELRQARSMTFAHGICLPNLYNAGNHGAERFPQYADLWDTPYEDKDHWSRMEAFEDSMMELSDRIERPSWNNGYNNYDTHGMNVQPFTQHESPQEQAAIQHGGEPSEWMVLLCMESVDQFNFWDAGTLSYCIHKKDLAIADFNRVVSMIESS